MKQPKYKGKEFLLLSVIDAARGGDAQAVESVLRCYEGYTIPAASPVSRWTST